MTQSPPGGAGATVSVVTPTLHRPQEVAQLLADLARQSSPPHEVIVVDGAPHETQDTEEVVATLGPDLPFDCRYLRRGGGTAVQRNAGLDGARGDFIAFVDDDIRLDSTFLEIMMGVFKADERKEVGGATGYVINAHLDPKTSSRWRWYRRLRLFTTYEPGRYDYASGYPINRYLQTPHDGLREVDVMGAGCAVWRKEVFEDGLRFSLFFGGFGVLEDAHLALRARRRWKLLECGKARCVHLSSPAGRENRRILARKTAVNYRYVFIDIVSTRTWRHEVRFWRVQGFDLLRSLAYALRHRRSDDWLTVLGKAEGIVQAVFLHPTHE